MWGLDFWKAAAERAIRGAASAVLAVITIGGVSSAYDVDWKNAAGVGLLAAVVSILFSLGGNAATGNGPAFNKAEQVTEPAEGRHVAEGGFANENLILAVLIVATFVLVLLMFLGYHLHR